MKRRLQYLIFPFLLATIGVRSQERQWETVPSQLDKQSQLKTNEDPEYNYGSRTLPSPRAEAVTWSDPKGCLYIFGGIGLDENKQWGIFRDMWRYDPVDNNWKLISGDRNSVIINGNEPADKPSPRRDGSTWVDPDGNLWLYGGRYLADLYHLDDMWKFDIKTSNWTKVSGKALFNQLEIRGDKKSPTAENYPGSRSKASSWTDKNGNLWLFGGIAYKPETEGKNDYFSDLWMFETSSNRWQWVSGASKPNLPIGYDKKNPSSKDNSPTPRASSATWYDQEKNQLWLYGGMGYDSSANDLGALSDLWFYDIATDIWKRQMGESELNKALTLSSAGPEHAHNHPGYRVSALTWTGKNGDLFLAAGQSSFSHKMIYIEKNVWIYSLKSGYWRILPQNDISVIGSGSSFSDKENNLYMFGGKEFDRATLQSRPSNSVRKIKL
ncbi:MAG: kelch repeat-containing protein [Dyadobacter sp.]|uniref:kelch repeat-containing protein n=1 Tax=Dyadobacter sp. TaxID=1914288 RepID=UPI00326557AA